MKLYSGKPFIGFFANDNDALIPEKWAQESLAILEENMVMGMLVHRDFEDEIASFGDVVNTRKPTAMEASRKIDTESVTTSDAASTNVAVPLNQHFHTSFIIKDGEFSKSFKNLVEFYLHPAVLSIAQAVDKVLCGQVARFAMLNHTNTLGTDPTNTTPMLDARNIMNKNKVPPQNRRLVLTPDTETALLKIDAFTSAEKVGDAGSALREASLGRKLGFDCFMAQNMPSITLASETASSTWATTVKTANAVAAGATTVTVTETDLAGTGVEAGDVMNLGGEIVQIRSLDDSTDIITFAPAVNVGHAAAEVITGYKPALSVGGEIVAFHDEITIDTMQTFQDGQPFIVNATDTALTSVSGILAQPRYSMISSSAAGEILLDRPLDALIADNAIMTPMPVGNYNFAFAKNAVALVSRPLATPMSGAGAVGAVASYNGLGIRVVITYDGSAQGHRVTVDLLCGVQVLDSEYGCAMLC